MIVRKALPDDAPGMSRLLRAIFAAWNSDRRGDLRHVREFYISHPDIVSCAVAVSGDDVLGFQSLKRVGPENDFGAPAGWGVIGTYVAPDRGRRGVGRALFERTLAAARRADLPAMEAAISRENAPALAYYGAMGFRTHDETPATLRKSYDLR